MRCCSFCDDTIASHQACCWSGPMRRVTEGRLAARVLAILKRVAADPAYLTLVEVGTGVLTRKMLVTTYPRCHPRRARRKSSLLELHIIPDISRRPVVANLREFRLR